MITREDVEKTPWIGEQRAQVLELIDRVQSAESALRASEKARLECVEAYNGHFRELPAEFERAGVIGLVTFVDGIRVLAKNRVEMKRAIARLLRRIDYETGDFVADCWCTSSGNEEPRGSVDIVCAACKARQLLGITKEQETLEVFL
jgi:hypothetical protein